ncbi:hypothetical protein KAR91_50325 [Candidatus Pacearchaeota archaeon]|nr:hypothetical protein [Candidatus Pacearchaeota archaeon]
MTEIELVALILFFTLGIFIGVGSYYIGRKSGYANGYRDSCKTRDLNRKEASEKWFETD